MDDDYAYLEQQVDGGGATAAPAFVPPSDNGEGAVKKERSHREKDSKHRSRDKDRHRSSSRHERHERSSRSSKQEERDRERERDKERERERERERELRRRERDRAPVEFRYVRVQKRLKARSTLCLLAAACMHTQLVKRLDDVRASSADSTLIKARLLFLGWMRPRVCACVRRRARESTPPAVRAAKQAEQELKDLEVGSPIFGLHFARSYSQHRRPTSPS
jgi:hypothetical protein